MSSTDTEAPRAPIRDLFDHGILKAPARIEGNADGKVVAATVEADGSIVWDGKSFASPSVAAGHAITTTTGRTTSGRKYMSVNGWLFWTAKGPDGQMRSLSELRKLIPNS